MLALVGGAVRQGSIPFELGQVETNDSNFPVGVALETVVQPKLSMEFDDREFWFLI